MQSPKTYLPERGETMLIVDKALERRASEGRPIKVGMIGAGFMGSGIARQIVRYVPGMELVAIANRNPAKAKDAFISAGVEQVCIVDTAQELEAALAKGCAAVTQNAMAVCEAEGIDAIVEVTGTVEFGAQVVLRAIEHGKHVVMMNAELDSTLGPLLKGKGDRAGVVVTNADGDQPGVIMNLYRFVKGIGVRPVLCGNIKGLHDPYRNPTTQAGFAQ